MKPDSLRHDVRLLGLKLDATTAELRGLKEAVLGRRVDTGAVRRQRPMQEAHEELAAFEAAFLRWSKTSSIDLRSSRQNEEAVRTREGFAWLVRRILPHLTWGQVGGYLGRDPSGIYRQARQYARRSNNPVALERLEASFRDSFKGEGE